jgi:hypothetical protein
VTRAIYWARTIVHAENAQFEIVIAPDPEVRLRVRAALWDLLVVPELAQAR